jgi:Ran GTPase-activating protein (RanGAP) involved in mRNA processing and transport
MEPLLEPLLDRPGDLSVLRVLSDALLEQGDPWGEAIQLALDLERTFPGEDAHRLGQRRLARLQTRYGPSWKRRLRAPILHGSWIGFFRGIPSKGSSHESALAALLDGPVASLQYSGEPAVLAWPRRSGLVELEIAGHGEAKNTSRLLGSGLTSLRSMSLPWAGDATLKILEQAPCTSQLEHLQLSVHGGSPVSPPQLERLLKLPLPKLRGLHLIGLELGLPGAERLAAMPWTLERLTLAGANLGVKGTLAFLASRALASVKELSLAQNTMGPLGAAALATCPNLKALVHLNLTSTASGAKSLLPLFESLALPSLKSLMLASCGLKGKALAPFAAAKSKTLGQLTQLDLGGNLMGDDGLTALSKSKALTGLRVLQLSANAIKGPGIAALGKSELLGKVEELALANNKFQNTGARGLAVSKKVGALKVLSLGHNWMGVQGLKALLANPALKSLEEVREGMNNYGPELTRSFAASKTLPFWQLTFGPGATTDELEVLFASPRVATLELLHLSTSAFDDAMAELAIKGPLVKGGTTVRVSSMWCKVTDAGAQKLSSALGNRVFFD